MPVQFACPNPECDASYSVADEHLGRMGKCKKCGTNIPLVPHTRVENPAPASQSDLGAIPKATEPALPESFGRYKVLKLLGRGGMGSVYLAVDTQLKRQVALKVPHIHAFADRPDVRERFFREAQAAARFHHPNFCPIHDIGEVANVPYLTMAFIEGKSLAESIHYHQGWPPRRAAEVVRELAIALAKAHSEGVIHRDLKPANIMVDTSGRMVLMDFGLARWFDDIDSSLTPTGAILGTPAYMPPEQAEGNIKAIGPRSDLYSLGVILYELLTGRRPFEGPITKVLGMIAFAEPISPSEYNPDVDQRLEAICLRAMAKKPKDRYASMEEFAGALSGFLVEGATAPTVARPESSEKQISKSFEEIVNREPTTHFAACRGESPPEPPDLEPSEDWSPPHLSPRPRRSRVVVGIAAALAAVAVLFGIIFISTPKGRIKIEVNDPNATVFIDGKNVRIEGLGEPIMLTTGEHKLLVKRGDIEVKAETFEVTRGDNKPLKITLEPLPAPNEKAPDQPMPPGVVRNDPPADPRPAPTPPPQPDRDAAAEIDNSLITNTIGMKLKLIPAGTFEMGTPEGEPGSFDDEKPRHTVRITKPFYLGVYEATQAEYQAVMGKNPSYFSTEGVGRALVAGMDTSRFPVENVSWLDAIAFCNKLSEKEGLRPCYGPDGNLVASGTGYRLPSEAEWEYACRAGTNTAFAFGGTLAPTDANFKGSGLGRTAQVGSYHRANKFGLYDMHGNAWEWCTDCFDESFYAKSPIDDPVDSDQATHRVRRGGSWDNVPRYCRSARRAWTATPNWNGIGFRVARVK